LQSSEEHRPRSGKPSLLTPAQQAEADRNRILTKLEHGRADHGAGSGPRNRILAWGGAGVAAVALLAGGGFWLSSERSADLPRQPANIVAPVPMAAPASVSVPAADAAPSAATIHDEALATGLLAAAPAAIPVTATATAPAAGTEAGPVPGESAQARTPKAAPVDLKKALETGSIDAKAKPAKVAASKPAVKVKAPTDAARDTAKNEQADSDVALLSALVAHTHATRAAEEPAAAPKERARSAKEELRACRKLKGKKARQCRVEACTGNWKTEPSCKAIEKSARPAAA
jgi:hypothetical protein